MKTQPVSKVRENPDGRTRRADWLRAHEAWLLGGLLVVAVLGVYFPALHNGFVNYDDDAYVISNARVQEGLNWENFARAFTGVMALNWHPLTMLSHMLDCQLFGLRPWGHHLTSILWHALDTLLVFLVWRRMTGATWRGFFVAALFGLHPAHVESVAWVAERKDVLSAFFWLLTMWFYIRYVEDFAGSGASRTKSKIHYGAAMVCFALGLLCKPMLVTLPFVLLLLDYWPLARWTQTAGRSVESARPANVQSCSWLRLAGEKVPFLLLAAAASLVTYLVQQQKGAMESLRGLTFVTRLGNGLVSYCRYLGELFWPTRLAAFYPHPGHWPATTVLAASVLLLGITVLAFELRKSHPSFLVGWLWFVGALVPVIGVVQVGAQAMADRYTYLPSLGVFTMVMWVLPMRRSFGRGTLRALAGAMVVVILLCAMATRTQIGYWKDGETLFRRIIAVTDTYSVPHRGLGIALLGQKRIDEAKSEFEEALRIKPDYAEAMNNLGSVLSQKGQRAEAMDEFRKAITLQPDYAPAHYNLAIDLQKEGRLDEAIVEFQKALKLTPDEPDAHNNLGAAFAAKGQLNEAIVQFQEAVRLKPSGLEARFNLGYELIASGRFEEAIAQFEEILKRQTSDAETHYLFGMALRGAGRADAAIAQFGEALKLRPNYPEAERQLRGLTNAPKP